MKNQILAGLMVALCTAPIPAMAALQPGQTAPDFTLKGSLSGQTITFNLAKSLEKGPVVVYFFPSAYTSGCDLEAHTFAENIAKFKAAGASVIGVSADNLARLEKFSADPSFCAGKFPIASDESTEVAKSYDLQVSPARADAKDVRGQEIGHAFIERVTYVIGKNGKILATLSSKTDGLSPDQHVTRSLAIIHDAK
jgi:peroxiredoxin